MTPEEESLAGKVFINAICKILPTIIERSESKNDKKEGGQLLNSLN